MGDFTGFSFDGHSSESLGIIRVSGGDRYDEELHPEINDRAIEVPGLNGQYYFGSDYGTKTIDIEFAFDHLDEQQFRKLRQVFGTKEIKELIFDERPYKYYMAKIENPIELSYVCFDEPLKVETIIEGIPYKEGENTLTSHVVMRPQGQGVTQRIYKGEGKITFICYFPFAKSKFKQLPFHFQLTADTEIDSNKKYFVYDEVSINYNLVESPTVEDIETYYERVDNESTQDWAFSSGILSINDYEEFDIYDSENSIIKIYNAGDIATGFRLYIPASNGTINTMTLNYKANRIDITDSLVLESMELEQGDEGILIDTYNELIVGVSTAPGIDITQGTFTYTTSGHLYNQHITAGYCFKLEPNINKEDYSILEVVGEVSDIYIFYDYLYF